MYKVGIIGAGKVGTSLSLYLFKKGDLRLEGFYSKSVKSAEYAAKLSKSKAYYSLEELLDICQILIITTPDDEIEKIWIRSKKFNIEEKIFCHCSGSLSSSVFFDSTTKGSYSCSMHPMLAISSKERSYKDLGGAFFTLEGDQRALDVMCKELELMKNPYKVLTTQDKKAYHLANVAVSNLVIGLGQLATNLLESYGFSEQESLEALMPLAQKNLQALFEKGPKGALTGPVERGDLGTIRGHLESLSSSNWELERRVYCGLSRLLLEIAKEKNPGRDYQKVEEELKKGEAGEYSEML